MKKLYPEESVQSIANAIRSKRNLQLNKAGQMKIADMAKAISGIRLGCPINVSVHMKDGVWVRPEGWTDLDALEYGEDELYMTFDASERISDSHCAFSISGASYTVEINGKTWTQDAGTTFSYGFEESDGEYPLVHVKADGHITSFGFESYSVDGRTYSPMLNPLLERVGDVYDYGSSTWRTYYLERERVIRHACSNRSLSNAWNNCYSLQSLDLSGIDTSNWAVTNLDYVWWSCWMLTTFKHSGTFAPKDSAYIRLYQSPMLTRDSLLEFGKMLGVVTTKHYFSIGGENSNKLTTEEKEEITAKGWTIT